jgi:biotin carboxyl carrier protein
MRYYATIGGRQRTVDVESLGGSRFRLSIDGGEPREVDAERVEGHVVNALVDGRSYDIDLEEDGDALNVLVEDDLFRVEVLDDRRLRLQQAKGRFSVAGPQVVKAPMPGKIVKVLVAVGDTVAENQALVVIEAMKMENELRAPKAGVVSKVLVKEGQTVEGRTELVSID